MRFSWIDRPGRRFIGSACFRPYRSEPEWCLLAAGPVRTVPVVVLDVVAEYSFGVTSFEHAVEAPFHRAFIRAIQLVRLSFRDESNPLVEERAIRGCSPKKDRVRRL